jgi:hypothetical protein
MSNNIWGYQGLQTPLENLTQGNYNVADYTNMRREFNARLQALENAGGFTPTNVSIQGYCNIVPGTNGFGNFSATGSTILGGTLNVASTATFQGGVTVAGALSVSSVNISSLTVDSITSTGNITSTAGQFIGNGSGLTGVSGTDVTKLPLSGGTLTGPLNSQNIVVSGGFSISGNGAGLTNINDITKLPLTGGIVSGALGVGGNLNTNGTFQALGDITAVSPAKFIGDGSGLTGVVATPLAPTFIIYTSSPGIASLNFTGLDNYIFLRMAGPLGSYVFTGRVIGQKITFVRESINLSFGVALTYLTSQPGSLPFRVYLLNGTIANLSVSNDNVGLSYTYASQQKIRNSFIVCESTVPGTYSFDLMEIS